MAGPRAFVEPAKPRRRLRFSYRQTFAGGKNNTEPNILHFAGQNDSQLEARFANAFAEDAKVRLGIEPR